MLFNLPVDQPKKCYSQEKETSNSSTKSLDNTQVVRASYQENLGILLNEKLNLKQHVHNAIMKVNKGICVIKKRRYSLPQKLPITIYKAFLQPISK